MPLSWQRSAPKIPERSTWFEQSECWGGKPISSGPPAVLRPVATDHRRRSQTSRDRRIGLTVSCGNRIRRGQCGQLSEIGSSLLMGRSYGVRRNAKVIVTDCAQEGFSRLKHLIVASVDS